MTNSIDSQNINMMMPLSSIIPLSFGNCRTNRDTQKYQDLLNSVKVRGVIQPILVRPCGEQFEVVAGYGRFQASTDAGLESIPCFIKNLSDSEALEHQLEENINRSDLDLIDECKAVQQLSAFYNGDKLAIADRLVWPMRKVNERIEILRCCDDVLEAVRGGSITVGHALIIAPFSEKLQQGTLAKVIAEKWTVNYLRERAGKGQQFLTLAKFDTTECNTCPHNSAAQSGLFGLGDHKAACSKLPCFRKKTSEWLETRKEELTEQYGTVLLIQQVAQSDRNTVDSISVGEEQFKTGCSGCEKRVALIDDRLGRSLGTTYSDQCIDSICYTKCVKALTEPVQELETESEHDSAPAELETGVGQESNVEVTKALKTNKPKSTPKKVNCNVPSKVVETNKSVLRKVSTALLMPSLHFQNAMNYAALRKLASGYTPLAEGASSTADFKGIINQAITWDHVTLLGEIANVTLYLSTQQSDCSINFTDVMISLMNNVENSKETAIKEWLPTKEILAQYTIDGIKILCNESGFTEDYDQTKKRRFEKLAATGKGKLIKAILEYRFNWSHFAPKEYIGLIK